MVGGTGEGEGIGGAYSGIVRTSNWETRERVMLRYVGMVGGDGW